MTRAPFGLLLLAFAALTSQEPARAGGIPARSVVVVGSYPHDPEALTQGLVLHQGGLYESTGGYGESSVRLVDPDTGVVLLKRELPADLFGEGLALHDGILYQLTWRAGRVLLYDPQTLDPLGEKRIDGEGWGLASAGHLLVVSDGSACLRFVDPASFAEVRRIEVRDVNGPVKGLNELEFVKGRLWANLFPTTEAVVIDPATGSVEARLNLDFLNYKSQPQVGGVPNGIAYDEDTGRLLVSGKRWPRVFDIELPRRSSD